MARQRFIWPDLWSDPGFASLDPLAQVLYIGCFSNADDEGRLHGDVAFLKATVFPRGRMSLHKLKYCRGAMLLAMPKLALYEVDGNEYLAFTNWLEWQKPKYPSASRLPAFPESFRESFPEKQGNGSGNDSAVGWVGLGRVSNRQQGKEQPPAAAEKKNEHEQHEPPVQKPKAAAKASGARPRDEVWDVLVEIFGFAPASGTDAHGARNRAVGQLRKEGATAGDVKSAAREYKRVMPTARFTDVALARHYAALMADMRKRGQRDETAGGIPYGKPGERV